MKERSAFLLITFCFCLVLSASAQNLSVRDIMAEPSIAGMRVEGEKLSPDGTKVVYLWNDEGKMPRDLYLVSTSGGEPTKLLSPRDLPTPSPSPTPENKLTYGLTTRDDLVKSRENQIGNLEWSPDSKKVLFVHSGDLYVLSLDRDSVGPTSSDIEKRWQLYEANMIRRANLVPSIVNAVKMAGIQEREFFENLEGACSQLLKAIQDVPHGINGAKSETQHREIISANSLLDITLDRLTQLAENYPILQSDERFQKLLDERAGVENRINVARRDYNVALPRLQPKRYTKTQTPEGSARFVDNDRILFSQSGNLFVLNTADATLIQISKEANPQTFVTVGSVTPNKTGTLVAYVVSDGSKQKALSVPNYLGEFTVTPSVRRGWTEQKILVVPADGSRDAPFEIKLPKPEGVSNIRRMVWADNSSLIIDRNDKDTKRRQLYYIHAVGSKGEQTILLTEETDDKWIGQPTIIVEPNPKDPRQILFGSERDGFHHLYLATLEQLKPEPNPTGEIRGEGEPGYSAKVKIEPLTKGNWQVEWAKWYDDRTIAYASTQSPGRSFAATAERRLFLYQVQTGEFSTFLSPQRGIRTGFQISELAENPVVLFEGSTWNHPGELYVEWMSGTNAARKLQLTQTAPAEFLKIHWTEPKFIDIPSRDGKAIKSKIYLPAAHDRRKKYPMVIFVHGAGYLQNVINGWNNYYREFMFNQILTQKGYVVLDIDYRGSAGYGRDWRTDVYDFLGGKDFDDHIDAIDFMVKNYNIDQKRIGVYGGSYGGFMAGMLAMRAPERIAAAAALRPVFDWKNYYAASPGYTAQRLGFPDKNPKAYERSSPITYTDKLERPLLILHGMADDNVHVQDSVQLIEKLIRLGKTQYFETMLYPSENHGFVRPESWTDEYERILAFFEKHLK